jgi:hypothetical protein
MGHKIRGRAQNDKLIRRGNDQSSLNPRQSPFHTPAVKRQIETRDAGLGHRVEPASGLYPVDLVNGRSWNLGDVVVLASLIQSLSALEPGSVIVFGIV